MIDLVKNFFGKRKEDNGKTENGSVHDVRIAACAILLEMSQIDGDFSGAERNGILTVLARDFGIRDEESAALLNAADEELRGSRDLWQFTRLINEHYSPEEKIAIIETVWRIAYTDGRLDQHEDLLVHKLANLLRLEHRQLIEAKVKVRRAMGIDRAQR